MIDPGLAALAGAFVGGAASLGATLLTGRANSRSAEKTEKKLVAATALLMQDDFYHFQVTLARALDRCGWWTAAEVLPQQTTVADRKTVWAALPDTEPSTTSECFAYILKRSGQFQSQAPSTITNAVADAQGWMDYLALHRAGVGVAADDPTQAEFDTMKWAFSLLDIGRRELQTLAHREATDFSKSHVFDAFKTCRSVADLLRKDCSSSTSS
jgi:hypothetical protein